MEKEFIPYEQALVLKELGFDEPCFGATFTFKNKIQDYITFCGQSNHTGYKNSEGEEVRKFLEEEYYISRPTFSNAFRWFREKYSICSWVYQVEENRYFFAQLKNGRYLVTKSSEYNTYEEAELECLKKLIEIVNKT